MAKKVLLVLASTFLVLVIIEFFSMLILDDPDTEFLFSLNSQERDVGAMNAFGFDEVHPLLGWKMSDPYIESLDLSLDKGFVVLQTKISCREPKKIFITGGSTTDIALHEDNWPVHLLKLLEENQHCATIYIGAVGGYNSGQEFLQVINAFDRELDLDIHISYSGANEFQFPNYVSNYEQVLFEKLLLQNQPTVMPHTIKLFQQKLTHKSNLSLSPIQLKDSPEFWLKNMKKMELFANANQYDFIGVLQPVINYAGLETHLTNELQEIMTYDFEGYDSFYPKAIESCQEQDFLYDMTTLFANETENVFIDDCHLKSGYQLVVAKEMYSLIENNIQN